MPRVSLLVVFGIASLIGSLLTVFKLINSGLYKRYRFFLLFSISRILFLLGPLILDLKSNAYFKFWQYSHPVFWVLGFLVVRELCSLILQNYTGLKTLGRWFMYIGIVISLLVSILSLLLKVNPTDPLASRRIAYITAIDRGVTAGLAVFLVVLLFLLSRYPIRLPRNVVVHSFLFTAFFLSNSLTMLFRSVLGIKVLVPIDIGLTVIATACSLAWFWLLNPKGEEVTVHVAHPDSKREEQLLSQLNYLNQTLIKTGKS